MILYVSYVQYKQSLPTKVTHLDTLILYCPSSFGMHYEAYLISVVRD